MIGAQEYSFLPETECHEILILYGQFYQVELSIKSLQYYGFKNYSFIIDFFFSS